MIYFLWVVVGHSATGSYVYDFFDPVQVGEKGLIAAYIYVLSLSVLMSLIVQEFHGLREICVLKTYNGRRTY